MNAPKEFEKFKAEGKYNQIYKYYQFRFYGKSSQPLYSQIINNQNTGILSVKIT